MARVRLKKILSDKNAFAPAFLDSLREHVSVQDAAGEWIIGAARAGEGCAIVLSGETLGWVYGSSAARVAAMVSALAAKEAERIALADEVLDKYREINLLYQLSEKLAATMELSQVAQIALSESARLIHSAAGELMLCQESGALERVATFGAFPAQSSEPGARIVTKVMETGKGEIVNEAVAAFVVAPLKSKERIIGAILLANEPSQAYSAGDLKLLTTVTSQAASQIEHAALYEKTLREAREREENLKKQIEALQIEVDESRTAKQVAEITETDYFQTLRQKANRLRYGKDE